MSDTQHSKPLNAAGQRDWPRYQQALSLSAQGASFAQIGREMGVTRARARQMVLAAERYVAQGKMARE